jgi:putative flippase GtrA
LVSIMLDKMRRFGLFAAVGWLGFILQFATLALLTTLAHWSWMPATIVAVEAAVVHNFLWHERVTWRDRDAETSRAFARLARFTRFALSTGLASLIGNTSAMALFVGVFGIHPLIANALASITISIANFVIADVWVFKVAAVALAVAPSTAFAAANPNALDAWGRYVAATEARLHANRPVLQPLADIVADGETVHVAGGTISDWRGAVFVPNVTLEQVLNRLQNPGTPPPQDDVLASRVLARRPDWLRVYMRLVRHAIVTATYDTEHEMTFERLTPTLAMARSVATKIEEVGGDRGFLWALNSYWRYERINNGVAIDVESLTLSRGVPLVARPIAAPIVTRIARESMIRTLEALRAYLRSPRG